jgi:hypothetical protein
VWNVLTCRRIQIYANLAAAELDIDFGQQYGLQFQAIPVSFNSAPRAVNPGDRFVVPVVLNSATDFVTVFDIHINFDNSLIEVMTFEMTRRRSVKSR